MGVVQSTFFLLHYRQFHIDMSCRYCGGIKLKAKCIITSEMLDLLHAEFFIFILCKNDYFQIEYKSIWWMILDFNVRNLSSQLCEQQPKTYLDYLINRALLYGNTGRYNKVLWNILILSGLGTRKLCIRCAFNSYSTINTDDICIAILTNLMPLMVHFQKPPIKRYLELHRPNILMLLPHTARFHVPYRCTLCTQMFTLVVFEVAINVSKAEATQCQRLRSTELVYSFIITA